jgi:ribonuclease E
VLGVIAAEAAEAQATSVVERQEPATPMTQPQERVEAVAAPEVREPAPQQARAERPAPPRGGTDRGGSAKAPAAAPAAESRALPKVQPFELPLGELAQIAEGSGLQWVNSDAERIAQARAAMDAEPKPVHVPRERPAAVVLDEGPLVLVETRRDLGSLSLPFEQAAEAQQPRA